MKPEKKIKIVVTGTRGIPDILGGVETHCEELFPRIVKEGYDVTVVRRSCYITDNIKIDNYKGIKLKDIYAPRKKSLEAFLHTFLAIIYARRVNADIVHIHAIGPALLVPFARLLGLKVVMTHHGPDYDRQKWGKLAKFILRNGERMGAKFSNQVIVISNVINNIIKEKYNRQDGNLIFNGVNRLPKAESTDYISSFGLKPKKYVLTMGRFVEEKGFDLLIKAFKALDQNEYQLVIAGDADHPSDYSEGLKKLAKENNVVLTGFIKGKKLNEILTNAALFVLPSFHEGLPIALLEAMSYDLDVLVSDIPANCIPELNENDFFKKGSIEDLTIKLEKKLQNLELNRHHNLDAYNWDNVAKQTIEVYKKVLNKKKK